MRAKVLKAKIEDYQRFVITLIILATYFYMGIIISVYIEESGNANLLAILALTSLTIAGWFSYLLKKWQHRLNEKDMENEHL